MRCNMVWARDLRRSETDQKRESSTCVCFDHMRMQDTDTSKRRLFVELPQHRRVDHAQIMIEISKQVSKKTLTKEQTIVLREKLCKAA